MTSGPKLLSEPFVFFGTGPVAASSLELLLENFEVEAVITKPKPKDHRGDYPVLTVAHRHNLRIIEVTGGQNLTEQLTSSRVTSQLAVLIDFGIIVSQEVIDFFPLGIINSHFSILPEWRGADPISFAILSGQKTTGVSLMQLVEAMDEGPLLGYGEYDLSGHETTPQLTEGLIDLSNELLKELLPIYVTDKIIADQSITGKEVSYSRKLTKADGVIDWNKPAKEIEREIRAFADWPKSRTQLAGKDVVITAAVVSSEVGKPGTVVINNKELHVCCNRGSLQILQLIPSGKKQMATEAFLAGHRNLI